MLKNDKGNWSKTKIGTALIGVSAVLATVGGLLTGSISLVSAITGLLVEVGGVLALFGVRDLPFVNKK